MNFSNCFSCSAKVRNAMFLMSGSRYENEGVFTPLQLQQIRKATLAAVLCNNGDSIDRVQVAKLMSFCKAIFYYTCFFTILSFTIPAFYY